MEWLWFGPFLAIAVVALAVWVWAIVDVVKVPDDSMFKAGNKLVWVLIVVLAGAIGAIIYLAVGRPSTSVRAAGPRHPGASPPPPPPPPGAIP
jgi:hypothetical protein